MVGPLANEIHSRCMEGVQKVCRRCMEGAQKVRGKCVGGDGTKNLDFMLIRF